MAKSLYYTHLLASWNSEADPADPPETQHPVQNRPWVPRAGDQDYGSLHEHPRVSEIRFRRVGSMEDTEGEAYAHG